MPLCKTDLIKLYLIVGVWSDCGCHWWVSPLSAETAAVCLKRNKESLGAVSVDSETGVCMTGLLLMADFSEAFQLPVCFSGPLTGGWGTKGTRRGHRCFLPSPAVDFLKLPSTSREAVSLYEGDSWINIPHIPDNVTFFFLFISLQIHFLSVPSCGDAV